MSRVEQRNVEWYRALPVMKFASVEYLERLLEYSATNPTGVKVGKMWRCHNGSFDQEFLRSGGIPKWVVCRYEEAPGEYQRTDWLMLPTGHVKHLRDCTFEENTKSRALYKLVQMCKTVTYRPVITKGAGSYYDPLPEEARKAILRAEGYRIPT